MVAGERGGEDNRTLKRLYSALFRPKMDYGCQLYSTASPRRLNKLNSINREGIRIYIDTFRTSTIESLHAEACDSTMEIRRNRD